MKSVTILGNWKSNKNITQVIPWVAKFVRMQKQISASVKVILCPPFHLLYEIRKLAPELALGTQDISPYGVGAYTGEVAADMVKDVAKYALIGHSERRKYFNESNEVIIEKSKRCLEAGMIPIICVSSIEEVETVKTSIPNMDKSCMLLYEPVTAISTSGSGQAENPQRANEMAMKMAKLVGDITILYGGSVSKDNVKDILSEQYISGVGVGAKSLDSDEFTQLILSAQTISSLST